MIKIKIAEVSEQIRGVSYKPADVLDRFSENGVGILRANNICDGAINFDDLVFVNKACVSQKQMLRKGDIIICASSGSKNLVGKAAQVQDDCELSFGAFCKVVRPKQINPLFLGMYFQSEMYRSHISNVSQGANINNIKNEHIDAIEIKGYSQEDQSRIANTLCRALSIINARREQLAALDNLIKARFVEMFGDVIQNNKNWSTHIFSEICASRLGKMLDGKQQTGESAYPYLANFNVQWFRFEIGNLNKMDFSETDRDEFELRDGDLLVCEGGEIGRCAVWHNEIQPCYFQKALHRVRCDRKQIIPDYLAWWFKYNCEHGGFSAIEGAKATIAHLPGAKLKQLKVVTPPVDVQNQFAAFVAQIDKSKFAVQKSLDEAQLLFDNLMQNYFG